MSRKNKAAELEQAWDIQITGRNVLVTDSMKDYAMEKISKIERFSNRIGQVNVIMDIQRWEQRVEIIVKVDNIRITSRANTNDMYASIDKAMDKLAEQIRRYKTRIQDHQSVGHDEVAMQVNVYSPSEIDEINDEIESQSVSAEIDSFRPHKIVKKETKPLKTLTHNEAIIKLGISSEPFIIFRCEEDRKIKVIYRRPDGNLGIVETEV